MGAAMRLCVGLCVAALSSPAGAAAPAPPTARVVATIRIMTPGEIAATCATVDANAGIDSRVADFWPKFERVFYTQAAGEIAALNKVFFSILGASIARVKSPADTAALQAWKDLVAKNQFMILALASHQITLMRCFFPLPGAASQLDEEGMKAAFRALALGLNANNPAHPNQGRMDSIHGWFHWATFINAYFAIEPGWLAEEDVAAWNNLRRHVLYGLLLHAFHDTLCPGPSCAPKPDFTPAGLAATDPKSLHDYAYDPATAAATVLDDFYRAVLADTQRFPMHKLPAAVR